MALLYIFPCLQFGPLEYYKCVAEALICYHHLDFS